jgi:hypothetical protein
MALRQRLLRAQLRLGDPPHERRGHEKRDRVDDVGNRGAPQCDHARAEDRPDHPRAVLGRLQERVRVRELVVADEVREPCIRGRPEEARGDSRHRCERHDARSRVDEREGGENAEAPEVGRDHQPSPGEAVDERPQQHSDQHDR